MDKEVVISGISGKFPSASNMEELGRNLYGKIDMTNENELRWRHTNPEIPKRTGKIVGIEKFDATFFGFSANQTNVADPQGRLLLECAYEAVLDAGVNPKWLKGSKTGVFIGVSSADSEKTLLYEKIGSLGRSQLATNISNYFEFEGQSLIVDAGDSSSVHAIDLAFKAITDNKCEAAIVGGSNLLLHPHISLSFARSGVLTHGQSRPMDTEANGYIRAEAVCVIFLQRASLAKRIYATILESHIGPDMKRFPDVSYIEGHLTGSYEDDLKECMNIDKTYSSSLLIGSVKSNMGHAEGASGLCSISKVLLAFQSGTITPNINFQKSNVPAITEGRLKVVTEPIKLTGENVLINSKNAQLLLRGNTKRIGVPQGSIPNLVLWGSTTEETSDIMEGVVVNPELISLINGIQVSDVNQYRSYGVFDRTKLVQKEVFHCEARRPLVWVFSGMGSQSNQMGTALMDIPMFKASIERLHVIMEPHGIDLKNILTSKDPKIFDKSVNSFVGIIAIQIAIVDILKELGVSPDFIIGHSLGELGCAYADGCLTAEEMILSAYNTAMACLDANLIDGLMAAVGLSQADVRAHLHAGIEVACHNGPDSCTVSGPAQKIRDFVADLSAKGIFAREIPGSVVPSHSKYVNNVGPKLLSRLQGFLKGKRCPSQKWISTSCAETTKWMYTADYQVYNLLNPVLFEEACKQLPEDSVTIEIAPHGLLQSILKKSMLNANHISVAKKGSMDTLNFFIGLGRLFINGVDFDVRKLYPPVSFPVSAGTPMISPLIRWDHSKDWFVPNYDAGKADNGADRTVKISLSDSEYECLSGHVIDGRVLLPATGYLNLVWETYGMMLGRSHLDLNVEFQDVKFLRATNLSSDALLNVRIHLGTGRFEITEGNSAVMTGIISALDVCNLIEHSRPPSNATVLELRDFYTELKLRGYNYKGNFRSVLEAQSDGRLSKVAWKSNFTIFMDCMLQIALFAKDTRSLALPTGMERVRINPQLHFKKIINGCIEVESFDELKIIKGGGVEIKGMSTNAVSRRKPPGVPNLEHSQFISHFPTPKLSIEDATRVCVQLMHENLRELKVKTVEVEGDQSPIIQMFNEILAQVPLVEPESILLTKKEHEDLPGIQIQSAGLKTQTDISLIIIAEPDHFVLESMKDKAFLLSRFSAKTPSNSDLICVLQAESETWNLFQYQRKRTIKAKNVIRYTELDIKDDEEVIVYTNESLRIDRLAGNATYVIIEDQAAPPFDPESPLFKTQLGLGLAVNVYKNGNWGSYRNLILPDNAKPCSDQCQYYVNALTKGDLSSLKWQERMPTTDPVRVQYASLNFRDVMLASGKLSDDFIEGSRTSRQCVLGLEYSGWNTKGRRVMGIVHAGALATHVDGDPGLMWDVPNDWSLEQAATVPLVYLTVYTSFFLRAKIEKGKKILIHAGTGGVGLAAIRVALAYGLEVFTTVSTQEKREYLLKQFPQLKVSRLGHSRDVSFYEMVMFETKGKGVDYVLNSLSEEKLLVSIKCLGEGGHFLEIGKYDITNDNKIGLGHFINEVTFHTIMVDILYRAPQCYKETLHKLIARDIKSGVIKPLKANVYAASEVEQAFRFLASGKHMGKVVLKIREDDKEILPMQVLSRFYCNPNLTYVIVEGMSGFGLELADWLVLRGCKKLQLASTAGVTTSFHKLWKSYDVQVTIDLVHSSSIAGIFIVNPSEIQKIDVKSQKHLQHFVVFCNQKTDQVAKSTAKRIVEARVAAGLPGKIIEWGAIEDVDELELDVEVEGLNQQRFSSCLQELDALVTSDAPLVSCMVVAEKENTGGSRNDLVGTIMNIMGLRDIKTISMDAKLTDLGMDSLMLVEVRQMLERNFEITLSTQEINSLTFEKLKELSGVTTSEK